MFVRLDVRKNEFFRNLLDYAVRISDGPNF